MAKPVPTRELQRLQGLKQKVAQLLEKNRLEEELVDDLKRLHVALEHAVDQLADLNQQGIALNDIESREIRHDIRNAIGITKGYAELIRDTADQPSASLSNLLDKILLWSAKTISTLEKGRQKNNSFPDADATLLQLGSRHKSDTGRAGHILILDDEAANRELLSRYIEQLGLVPFSCANAEAAYSTLREESIDLILLDLLMPEVSGHEVLAELKASELWRAIPVIVISGLSDQAEVIRCIKAGADDYLQKPFNKILLQARLDAGLDRKSWVDKERHLSNELEKSHAFIRNTFGRYLSNEIVANLLEKPDGLDMGGQLQTVTILMADIRGFTTVCESLEPQKVVKLLNNYLGSMADIIMANDGTVDEFIGDAILALFGAPVPREDDCDRAINCALQMQAAIERVNELNAAEGLPEIGIGIGVNTGEVIAGNIGSSKRAKYGVVGHAVNVTSRIEDKTEAGEILVAQSTIEACQRPLQIGRQLELQPKGVRETIAVSAVVGFDDEKDENVTGEATVVSK